VPQTLQVLLTLLRLFDAYEGMRLKSRTETSRFLEEAGVDKVHPPFRPTVCPSNNSSSVLLYQ